MLKTNLKYLIIIVFITLSCSQKSKESDEVVINETSELITNNWINSEGIFEAKNTDESIECASIINFEGNYHLFYTCASSMQSVIKYTSASSLNKLNYSERFLLNPSQDNEKINPEVFYSESQKIWYLFASSKQDKSLVYSTSTNINDTSKWSVWKKVNMINNIDQYYTIANEEYVHIFYTNDQGELFKTKSLINSFPEKFSTPEKVRFSTNKQYNFTGSLNINYSRVDELFIAITDSNNGFTTFTSSSLDGEWKEDNRFKVDVNNIVNTNGSVPNGLIMRNPRVLLEGYNQKKIITDFKIFYLSNTNHTKLGDKLKWGLSLITKQ